MRAARIKFKRLFCDLAFWIALQGLLIVMFKIGRNKGRDCQLVRDLAQIANVSSVLGLNTASLCMEAMKQPLIAHTPIFRMLSTYPGDLTSSPLEYAQQKCSIPAPVGQPWLALMSFLSAIVLMCIFINERGCLCAYVERTQRNV